MTDFALTTPPFSLPQWLDKIMPSSKGNRTHSEPVERQERLHETLKASGSLAQDPGEEAQMRTRGMFSQMVDMRIPLWGILSAAAVFGGMMVNMYINVQQLNTTVAQLVITLQAGNATAQGNAVELRDQRTRIEYAERSVRDFQTQINTLQAQVQQNSISIQRPNK